MEPPVYRSPSKEGQPPRMVCVIFVAGHNDRLEKEIASDMTSRARARAAQVDPCVPMAHAYACQRLRMHACCRRSGGPPPHTVALLPLPGFDKLKGVPKALLPAAAPNASTADELPVWGASSGSTILSRWWMLVNTRQILEVM